MSKCQYELAQLVLPLLVEHRYMDRIVDDHRDEEGEHAQQHHRGYYQIPLERHQECGYQQGVPENYKSNAAIIGFEAECHKRAYTGQK